MLPDDDMQRRQVTSAASADKKTVKEESDKQISLKCHNNTVMSSSRVWCPDGPTTHTQLRQNQPSNDGRRYGQLTFSSNLFKAQKPSGH